MQYYDKRLETVIAEQFDGSDEMVKKYGLSMSGGLNKPYLYHLNVGGYFIDETETERMMYPLKGDWLVTRYDRGRYLTWVMEDSKFQEKFKGLEDMPKPIKDQLYQAESNGTKSIYDLFVRLAVVLTDQDLLNWCKDHANEIAVYWLFIKGQQEFWPSKMGD